MNPVIDLQFKRHRAQVTTADTSPVITEQWSDLSTATKAKFKKIEGKNPVLLFKFGGAQSIKEATVRIYAIDEINQETESPGIDLSILSWIDDITVTTDITRRQLNLAGLGSKIFVVVESLTSNTTLDIFIADDVSNT
ncbi:MAG: hypothetical protein U9P90_02275 [Patescibacteria group bacterium]|nr:hypothetical protein [Patescibacteria group bacterium]